MVYGSATTSFPGLFPRKKNGGLGKSPGNEVGVCEKKARVVWQGFNGAVFSNVLWDDFAATNPYLNYLSRWT